jgi:hypothetical protein
MVETNKVNTAFTDEMLQNLKKEERDTFLDYIQGIKFIQHMIDPNRKYAKDLKRYKNPNADPDFGELEEDPKGRIRVDIGKPHILENMDYFRQSAITFEKHGRYTLLMPSSNPYSDYRKFWDREIERCWYGMKRESDGEWITGYHYFYLNYSQISMNKITPGTKRAERIQAFPDFYDGDYLFFHYIERARDYGKHTCTLKKRGAGYSLKGGGKLARNFLLGETANANTMINSFAIANEKEYLTKDGVLNKFVSILDFCGTHTPFPRRKELKDSWNAMHWVMGFKDAETGLEKGTHNQVMGITLKNDPERARGKRGVLIEWEEFGKFNDALKAWNIGRPSVEADGFAFGLMNAYGTGGTEGAAFEGLRELFYNPDGYNVFAIDNVFDKNVKGNAVCAFFHATYLNAEGKMDKDGNSDVTRALLDIIKDRIKIKYNSREPATLMQTIAEKPITPQEAIMKVGGSIFPTVDIRDYLEEARVNEARFTENNLVGELILVSENEVKFEQNPSLIPIRRYLPDKGNVAGAVEIFRMPETQSNGVIPAYRYIAGIDPVDNDYISTGSLASIFVFDMWTDQIVAEYTGRPNLAEEFYEICRRMMLLYNAQGNYENNIKGLFGYFNNKNSLYLLCDTPQYLRDIEEVKSALYGNRAKGTRTTPGVRAQGKRLQKSWMMKPCQYIDGEGEEKIMPTLRTIKSLGYLEELYEWNDEGNFDRVSAMDMVMILREDRLKLVHNQNKDAGLEYVEEDEFIAANFDQRFSNRVTVQDLSKMDLFKQQL